MGLNKDYEDIPGTFVFDADRGREGYHLNQFCISLRKAPNREAFGADEGAYLDKYKMTEEQRQAVIDRDWNQLLELLVVFNDRHGAGAPAFIGRCKIWCAS